MPSCDDSSESYVPWLGFKVGKNDKLMNLIDISLLMPRVLANTVNLCRYCFFGNFGTSMLL